MMKAWKEFWSDYNEMVLKNSNKWLERIYSVMPCGILCTVCYYKVCKQI